jgi:hypothetical protein
MRSFIAFTHCKLTLAGCCCLQGVVYAGREDFSNLDNYLAEVAVDILMRSFQSSSQSHTSRLLAASRVWCMPGVEGS